MERMRLRRVVYHHTLGTCSVPQGPWNPRRRPWLFAVLFGPVYRNHLWGRRILWDLPVDPG